MNRIASIVITTTVTAFAFSGLVASGAQGDTRDARHSDRGCHLSQQEVSDWGETSSHLEQACHRHAFTDLDHPSRACRLSEADVANWGETSAHLPQACSYGRK